MLEINIHEDTTGDDYCSLIELAFIDVNFYMKKVIPYLDDFHHTY